MSRAPELTSPAPTAGGAPERPPADARISPPATAPRPTPARDTLAGKHVCPFCGQQNLSATEPCPRCTMEDTAATRQATKARIGPWYVLQTRNPAAPGMKFQTLLALIAKGQVTARSVVRGPTTHQLWRYAAHVRGLSREFGACYSCGEAVDKAASLCPHCERAQEPPQDPDQLLEPRGLNSARLGGVTGNSHGAIPSHRPREYEIPQPPPAQLPVVRGEHAERLRAIGQPAVKPRVEMARGEQLSGMALASALHPGVAFDEHPPSAARRTFGIVFLLLLIGGGAFMYFNPSYRAQTGAWFQEQWRRGQEKINAPEARRASLPRTPPDNPSLVSSQRKPAADESYAGPAIVAPDDAGSIKPAAEVKKPAVVEISPPPSAPPANDATQSETNALDAALGRARKLWTRAIDAESRGNFDEAVRYYEEIKRLPPGAHPGGLQFRLDSARRAAASR